MPGECLEEEEVDEEEGWGLVYKRHCLSVCPLEWLDIRPCTVADPIG
jgi:hypothetical protein